MKDKYKETYIVLSPTKGEDDWEIHKQYSEHHKSVNDIAFEFDKDTSSIYRAIQRVERFSKNDLSYYDFEQMMYIAPQSAILCGAESLISHKIAYMAITIFYNTGAEYLDKFYCNLIQNIHPCVKNNKRKIMEEMKNVHWYFMDTKIKIYIFDSFVFSRNRIDFQINDLVRIMLLSAKSK